MIVVQIKRQAKLNEHHTKHSHTPQDLIRGVSYKFLLGLKVRTTQPIFIKVLQRSLMSKFFSISLEIFDMKL